MLLYHHCRSLESVVYGEVKPNPHFSDEFLKRAYSWMEQQLGFYPLFIAVGEAEEDIRMTGYENQWRRIVSKSQKKTKYRTAGEFPNEVLFSFSNLEGVFTDYDYWIMVLNTEYKNYQVTDYEKKLLFKPSWNKAKWLRRARERPHTVQLVIPKLYLPDAEHIWVRNKKTKKQLEKIGFEGVEVKRLMVME